MFGFTSVFPKTQKANGHITGHLANFITALFYFELLIQGKIRYELNFAQYKNVLGVELVQLLRFVSPADHKQNGNKPWHKITDIC